MRAEKSSLFPFGVLLFLLGIVGVLWFGILSPVGRLDDIFPSDVALFTEVSFKKDSLQKFQALFPDADMSLLWEKIGGDIFSFDFENDVLPWAGKHAGVAFWGAQDFVLGIQYRHKSKAEDFLGNFRLSSETFEKEKIKGGEIWTPEFSSRLAFGFLDGYVFFASSADRLKEVFLSESSLSDVEYYQKIRSDLSRENEFFLFAESEASLPMVFNSEEWATKKPLLEVLSQTLPSFGISADINKQGIEIQSKIITKKGVFSGQKTKKPENQTLPELAQFASQNVLFFMNGSDVYAKYLHTKEFLSSFHPQFSVVFDGVLRGLSREMFGKEFDFERDALAKMHGQYAILFDFPDVLSPFVNFTLITGFGSADTEKNLAELSQALHFAQGQFSAQSREVKLPDGSVREELVAVDTQELPIKKVEFNDYTYYTFEPPVNTGQKFSYAFLEGYFVFSTHEDGVRSTIASYTGESLAENADFRESVLFHFSPSESYGFLNYSKLDSVFELFLSEESNRRDGFLSFFRNANVRNLVFSRKVFPTEIFWTAILFQR